MLILERLCTLLIISDLSRLTAKHSVWLIYKEDMIGLIILVHTQVLRSMRLFDRSRRAAVAVATLPSAAWTTGLRKISQRSAAMWKMLF